MLSLIVSVLALGWIIFFHELGHFLTAKCCGVGVVEFSLGMGPRLFSFVRGNTRYSLRCLPFGGSCMMAGEEFLENGAFEPESRTSVENDFIACDTASSDTAGVSSKSFVFIDGRSYRRDEFFTQKKTWQRFLIIAAGPFFNYLFAFFLSLILTQQIGYDRPTVISVEQNMPAASCGITAGDRFLSINGRRVRIYRDLQLYLLTHQQEMAAGTPVRIRFATPEGEVKQAVLTPAYAEDTQSYRMGIVFSGSYVPAASLGELVYYSYCNIRYCLESTLESLRMLFLGRVQREDLMGPVRMVAVMDSTVEEASQYGARAAILSFFDLLILISASLGAMNLLPLPALDGGQLLFILIEMIARRPVPRRIVAAVNMTGMAMLLLLMCFVLFNDITLLL